MRQVFLVCAGAAAAGILSTGSFSAQATTTPGVLYVAKLIITDDKIILGGDRFTTRQGIHRYPRGSEFRYDVLNKGTRAFGLNILGSSTGMLAPGKQSPILVNWDRRGRFMFRAVPNGPRIRIWVF